MVCIGVEPRRTVIRRLDNVARNRKVGHVLWGASETGFVGLFADPRLRRRGLEDETPATRLRRRGLEDETPATRLRRRGLEDETPANGSCEPVNHQASIDGVKRMGTFGRIRGGVRRPAPNSRSRRLRRGLEDETPATRSCEPVKNRRICCQMLPLCCHG